MWRRVSTAHVLMRFENGVWRSVGRGVGYEGGGEVGRRVEADPNRSGFLALTRCEEGVWRGWNGHRGAEVGSKGGGTDWDSWR